MGGGNIAGNPDGNSADYSFASAFGENNKALGRASFVSGNNNEVSGNNGVAFGESNIVRASDSISVGSDNISDGNGNALFGNRNVAKDRYGFASGTQNTVSGEAGFASGTQNTVSGEAGFASGTQNTVSSAYEGTALGLGHNVSGNYSLAAGVRNTVTNSAASVFGIGNSSSSDNQTVVGRYNKDDNDAAFIIGNGFTDYKQNAFEVLWDGRAKLYGTPKGDDDVVRLNDLNNVEARLNENIIKNPDKTYLVWYGNKFPNDEYATIKGTKSGTVDWGDGTVEHFEEDSKTVLNHTYNDSIQYHLIALDKITLIESSFNTIGSTSNYITKLYLSVDNLINRHILKRCFLNQRIREIVFPKYGNYAIDELAFYKNYYLKHVDLGEGIRNIGDRAFANCAILTTVKISNTTNNLTTLNPTAFNGCYNLRKIIVPKYLIEEYKSAEGWSQYADKIVYEVDSSDTDLKLDKMPVYTFGGDQVIYGWKPDNSEATTGTVQSYRLFSGAKAFSIAYRDINGRLQASDGVSNDDLATIRQLSSTNKTLQDNIDTKVDKLVSIKGDFDKVYVAKFDNDKNSTVQTFAELDGYQARENAIAGRTIYGELVAETREDNVVDAEKDTWNSKTLINKQYAEKHFYGKPSELGTGYWVPYAYNDEDVVNESILAATNEVPSASLKLESLVMRDINGRAKIADGVSGQDIVNFQQLNKKLDRVDITSGKFKAYVSGYDAGVSKQMMLELASDSAGSSIMLRDANGRA